MLNYVKKYYDGLDMFGGEMTTMFRGKVWNLKVGTRGNGRPKIRRKDSVEEDMREQSVQPRDAEERLEWTKTD